MYKNLNSKIKFTTEFAQATTAGKGLPPPATSRLSNVAGNGYGVASAFGGGAFGAGSYGAGAIGGKYLHKRILSCDTMY